MKAKEWIQKLHETNEEWAEIDWEAVDEISDLLNHSELNDMGKAALLGGLTVDDIRTLAKLKRNGLMPLLVTMERHDIKPEEIGLSKLTFTEVKK